VTCNLKCSAAVSHQSLGVKRKLKVNEWVETVRSQLTTPVKMNLNDKDVTTHDSAKKRRQKFVKYACFMLPESIPSHYSLVYLFELFQYDVACHSKYNVASFV
jgi:hypothetical protein